MGQNFHGLPNIRENFIYELSFSEPSAKFCPMKISRYTVPPQVVLFNLGSNIARGYSIHTYSTPYGDQEFSSAG